MNCINTSITSFKSNDDVLEQAARIALERSNSGPVTMEDFKQAIDIETEGRLHCNGKYHIGFVNS